MLPVKHAWKDSDPLYRSMSDDALKNEIVCNKLCNTVLIILDEVSMISNVTICWSYTEAD